jgi:poly-gamma-glutamate capsule biosynthesis protein CapA/YwtB (metallophosphatase superfamily)
VTISVALAGDTMLGRGVAEILAERTPESLVAPDVVEVARSADLFVLNLECCISDRGSPWPAPGKPFFFRAPLVAVEVLRHLGVSAVTLANNHALDFGHEALEDTLRHLEDAGIPAVGAGLNLERARRPIVLENGGFRLGLLGLTDHPEDFAAGPDRPGVAFADLQSALPPWVPESIGAMEADAVLVTPHWGPNMTAEPTRYARRAARELVDAGATVVAGHSAHVFHGVAGRVLFDLGDFLDDYAVDPSLRNDLGLLWLVTLDRDGPLKMEAVPLRLDYCYTRLADGDDAAWIRDRFRSACGALGTDVADREGRLTVSLR